MESGFLFKLEGYSCIEIGFQSYQINQIIGLAGLAVARDGSLLVADDSNGIIYRVSYGDGGRQ